jgi:hypothetical protein
MAIDLTQVTIDYTSKDFQAFRNDMFQLASIFTPEWNNRADSDLGVILVNEFALGLDILSFYQDRIANECFLPTAQLRSSIINLLSLIGYTLDTASPASADVMFTIQVSSSDTNIYSGYRVGTTPTATSSAVSFEVGTPLVIPAGYAGTSVPTSNILAGSTSGTFNDVTGMAIGKPILLWNGTNGEKLTVTNIVGNQVFWGPAVTTYTYTTANGLASGLFTTVTEGTSINSENIGTSNGSASQKFLLTNAPVVEPTVVVVVNEGGFDITWTKVDNFLASSSTDRHFTTTVNANDQVIITFGDGNLGKIPPLGSSITASYRIGGGTRGNVGAGQINALISSSPTNVLSVVNPLAASGGIDRESNEEAKILGPLFARANDRAITKQDYETLAASFSSANGSINKALAVATNYNNVNIYAAVQGPNGTGVPASAALKADLKNYLDSKGMIWVTTTILDPIYSPVDITLNLKVLGNYVGTQVQSAVNASLQNFLAFENQDFDGTLRLSDAYNVINQNQGIDYFNITKFQRSSDPPMAPADIVGLPSEIFEPGTITINLI